MSGPAASAALAGRATRALSPVTVEGRGGGSSRWAIIDSATPEGNRACRATGRKYANPRGPPTCPGDRRWHRHAGHPGVRSRHGDRKRRPAGHAVTHGPAGGAGKPDDRRRTEPFLARVAIGRGTRPLAAEGH